MLHRRQDWMTRFVEYIRLKRWTRFKFGEHDCCISVADCVLAMTDTDIAAEFRGYNEKGAARYLRDCGGVAGIVESVVEQYEMPEILKTKATQGDMCLISPNGADTMAVVGTDGRHVLAAGKVGWVQLPLLSSIRAWRVG